MSLMPFIRFLVFKRLTCRFKLVAVILLLSKIISTYSHYAEKGLIYIAIIALFSRQLFSYTKCIKSNIRSFYNIRSVFNAKYIFLARFYTF